MSEIDQSYSGAQAGNEAAFAAWVRLVEMPLRRSLQSFARGVDVESVLQEGLLRMWVLAPRLALTGRDASLRYAFRLTQNLAISEARRLGTISSVPLEETPDDPALRVDPDPLPDLRLRKIILGCIEKLPERPRRALRARLRDEGTSDRERAAVLGMKVNTFLQHIVRARRLVRTCLEKSGLRMDGVRP
jgi:DNA-directed RNA polymerase specialized sigma24 family protein